MAQTSSTQSTPSANAKKRTASRVSLERRRSRARRHARLRKKVAGTPVRPRLVVNRSARHMVAQLVDDVAGHTIAAVSWTEASLRDKQSMEQATEAGKLLAERAKAAGIDAVVFDRGGNRYAGRIAALADGAREGGLDF